MTNEKKIKAPAIATGKQGKPEEKPESVQPDSSDNHQSTKSTGFAPYAKTGMAKEIWPR